MEYRKDKEVILNNLYEQPGLSRLLGMPSDKRQHFLSIVLRLPKDKREQLSRDAIDWTNGWEDQIYYIQRTDSIHLTFVEIGPINNFPMFLKDIVIAIKDYLQKVEKNNLLILTEPKIGRSGINCEFEVGSPHLNILVEQLHKKINVEHKDLRKQSISLVRYLIPEPSFKLLLEKGLSKIEKLNVIYNQKVNVEELHLVRIDKVADYFQTLNTFTLK